ncbi:hypothetical protein ACH5RR_033051 [Cinchona calisaya]|uniref:Non-haem dioxygenase N-terminal domain-containing protein n=1 Tax=Cinchona calisaya TaxID=153742 RepID=A0ABD2YP10_9GENT
MENSNGKDIASQLAVDGDRLQELKAFDNTKAGVKGLVDSGVTTLPRIFILPPEELIEELNLGHSQLEVPVIDLSGIQGDDQRKTAVIDEILRAQEEWGFFQVTNHGIPDSVLGGMIDATHQFHEQDVELKKQFYSRDPSRMVRYYSNVDLHQSRAAIWKDTLAINLMAPK